MTGSNARRHDLRRNRLQMRQRIADLLQRSHHGHDIGRRRAPQLIEKILDMPDLEVEFCRYHTARGQSQDECVADQKAAWTEYLQISGGGEFRERSPGAKAYAVIKDHNGS